MPQAAQSTHLLRFGAFELDLRAGELRKQGLKIRLQEKPLQVLALLLEHPGEVVTREELRRQLWAADTFVDFDHSVNTAVNKLREALNDSAENPRFVETLRGHGYRFIAPVEPGVPVYDRRALGKPAVEERKGSAPGETSMKIVPDRPPADSARVAVGHRKRRRWLALVAVVTFVSIAVFGTLFALNIGGLRGRFLSSAGANRGGQLPKIESIAVLPLENLTGDPEQEYFADGMTEELITDLGRVGALRVISRTSVMRYKGTTKPLPEIARELNVDAIVEGAVMRSGDRVRITAQLIDARDDRHLWARAYERNLGDVLALQSEVTLAIARKVQAKLTAREQARFIRARPVNPEAYRLYLKGRYEWNKRTKVGLNKALEYFQQGIRADAGSALAYSGLADTYFILGNNAFVPGAEVYPKAKAAALKALQLDKDLAEAHASMAAVLFDYERDRVAALKEYETAIELNPNYATAHHWYANSLAAMGRRQEAIPEIELARNLDPLSARTNANVGYVLYMARQYDRAIPESLKAIELDPRDRHSHTVLGFVYLQKRMNREALVELQKAASLATGPRFGPGVLALAYAAAGNRDEALRALQKSKKLWKDEYVSPYRIASIYVALHEKDKAFAWLEKGVADYDGQMDYIKVDPAMDPLRSDPRFQSILRRMNFPP